MKKIVQIIPYFFPAMSFGGPAKVVCEFSKELSKKNKITILTSDVFNKKRRILNSEKLPSTKNFFIIYFKNILNGAAYFFRLFTNFGIISFFLKNSRKNEIYHFHDVFVIPQIMCSLILRARNQPYVVSPHGVLDPVRLTKKSFVKVMLLAFVLKMMKSAKCVIATSDKEKLDLQKFGIRNIEVVYNGISNKNTKNSHKFDKYVDKKKIILLYVGKLHPQKGLLEFILALKKSKRNDFQLLIAGEDDGDKTRLVRLVSKLKLSDSVYFLGFANEEDKQSLYEISDLFIHPSHSEGFSISILEALNNSVPVLITQQCNFDDVALYNAGIIANSPGVKNLATILSSISKKNINKFKINTKKLIEKKYSIKIMSDALEKIYEQYI